MPLKTKTIDLQDEIESLRGEMEEIADQVSGMDDDSPGISEQVQEGQTLDRYISGLYWYRDEYESDEIVLGALTNGERNQVRDTVSGSGGGAQQNAYVAMGTVEAGYIEHDHEEDSPFGGIRQDKFKQSVQNVANLHPAFVDWAESEITSLGRMDGGMGNSFRDLVQAKQTQASSGETNG